MSSSQIAEQQKPSASRLEDAPSMTLSRTSHPKLCIFLVLIGGLWFAVCTLCCCVAEAEDPAVRFWHPNGAHRYHEWLFVGFCATFVQSLVTLLQHTSPAKRWLAALSLYINLVAAISCMVIWLEWSIVLQDAHTGRPVHPVRWAMWAAVTPVSMFMVTGMSTLPRWQVYMAVIFTPVMILSGFAIHMMTGFARVVLTLIALSMFPFIMAVVWRATVSPLAQSPLTSLRWCVLLTWSAFPVVWLAAQAGSISLLQEEQAWAVLDFLGKGVQTTILLQMNLYTVDVQAVRASQLTDQRLHQFMGMCHHVTGVIPGVSSDMINTLNGMIGLAESLLLNTCGPLTPEMVATVATVKHSGEVLRMRVANASDAAILALRGSLKLRKQSVDLASLLLDVVKLAPAPRGVVFSNSVEVGSLPLVPGDAMRLSQAMFTLLHGVMTRTVKGRVEVTASVSCGLVRLMVVDAAPPLTPDEVASIMEGSWQTPPVGLSLSRQLMELHDGALSITPMLHGNVYKVELPAERGGEAEERCFILSHTTSELESCWVESNGSGGDPTPGVHSTTAFADMGDAERSLVTDAIFSDHPPKQPPKGSHRSKTGCVQVLSVDDDPINQMVVQDLLTSAGYVVVQAMDALEGMEFLLVQPTLPDVILLDVMMPGMSGYEMCRRIRIMYPDALIPIIIVSAKTQPEHIVEGLRAGANDYVTKPFERIEIQARIEAHINFRAAVSTQMGSSAATAASAGRFGSRGGTGSAGRSDEETGSWGTTRAAAANWAPGNSESWPQRDEEEAPRPGPAGGAPGSSRMGLLDVDCTTSGHTVHEAPSTPGRGNSAGDDDDALRAFLEEAGLESHTQAFIKEGIVLSLLPHLKETSLERLGMVNLGDRLRLRQACKLLQLDSNNS